MKEKEKILLLTDIQPCKNYSGSILSAQLVKYLLEEKIFCSCICIKSPFVNEDLDQEINDNIETIIYTKPEETGRKNLNYDNEIKKISKKVIDYVIKNNITKIWCPIQGETILRVLGNVVKKTNVEYIPQIWDPIEWMLLEKKYDKEYSKEVVKLYDEVVGNAKKCLTASFAMSELYEQKYKKKYFPMYSSFDFPIIKTESKLNKKDFIISLAGQTYASVGIEALFKALDKINWKYREKNIKFQYFGPSVNPLFHKKKYKDKIILRGYVAQDYLMIEQNKADLLYCPYFFENKPELQMVARLSFPSKVATYIPSKKPILIHSEKNASIYRYFEKYNAGFLLSDIDPDNICKALKNIIDKILKKECQELINNSKKLFDESFTKQVMKDNFFKALNLKYSKEKKLRILHILKNEESNYILQENKFINNKMFINSNNELSLLNNKQTIIEEELLQASKDILKNTTLSIKYLLLEKNDYYKNCDIVHINNYEDINIPEIVLSRISKNKILVINMNKENYDYQVALTIAKYDNIYIKTNNTKIYDELINRYNIEPKNILFIEDNADDYQKQLNDFYLNIYCRNPKYICETTDNNSSNLKELNQKIKKVFLKLKRKKGEYQKLYKKIKFVSLKNIDSELELIEMYNNQVLQLTKSDYIKKTKKITILTKIKKVIILLIKNPKTFIKRIINEIEERPVLFKIAKIINYPIKKIKRLIK